MDGCHTLLFPNPEPRQTRAAPSLWMPSRTVSKSLVRGQCRCSDQQVYEFIRGAEGAVNVADIYTGLHSNLSKQQIRYIITKLLNAGLIVREGGQGNRNTTYRVAQ